VAEPALDDDQRYAFVGHLDGVRVAQLVRSEPAANPGELRGASQLLASSRRLAVTACGCTLITHTSAPTGRRARTAPSPAARMTAMISSIVGGSAG
jgi:hypothetical protein